MMCLLSLFRQSPCDAGIDAELAVNNMHPRSVSNSQSLQLLQMCTAIFSREAKGFAMISFSILLLAHF